MQKPIIILAINPGSTSTKIAIYDNAEELYKKEIHHTLQELSKYQSVMDQLEFRKFKIVQSISSAGYIIDNFTCVVARGGHLKPISAGTYLINEIEAADTTGINRVVWNMTKKTKRSEQEIEEIKKRLQGRRELRESDKYETTPMPPGEYKVVLIVNGQKYSRNAIIMPDHWYDK